LAVIRRAGFDRQKVHYLAHANQAFVAADQISQNSIMKREGHKAN
jgi:hypothetical protein